ncbi:hypothetical protein CFP56_028802 [Quercus suber]|uniref:RNase H type-1 domain-containing protein n=1 Tax=Quercus suber TaxID=58331 RepID=A0AAW0JTG2_QUESU
MAKATTCTAAMVLSPPPLTTMRNSQKMLEFGIKMSWQPFQRKNRVEARSNGDFSRLVDDCRDLLLQLPQAKVSHCYREANFCADALAKLGASSIDVGSRFAAPYCYKPRFAF